MNKDRTVWIIVGAIVVLGAIYFLWRGKSQAPPNLINDAEKVDQTENRMDNKMDNETDDKMTVKVYFGDCDRVTAVTRQIPQTSGVGRAALNELLGGPTEDEISAGQITSIPAGVKLNSLVIANGVALADFSAELGQNVAGSCPVQAIRSQIEETLKQFPTVNRVVISIDGKSEGILQP